MDTSGIEIVLILAGAIQIAIVITFFQMASQVSQLKKNYEQWNPPSIRRCHFCFGPTDPLALVCRHCSRDIGSWLSHNNKWWTRNTAGAWYFLDNARWNPPDPGNPAPGPLPSAP